MSTTGNHVESTVASYEHTKNEHGHGNKQHVKEFSAVVMYEAFQQCLTKSKEDLNDHDDILIKEYVLAYEQMCTFLEKLGSLFYFVIVDLKEKINILENHLKTNPHSYRTLLTMIEYEKSKSILTSTSHHHRTTNGSRTILRLHRALIFIYKFLERLFNAEPKLKSSQLCLECYESTLGKYHTWLIRRATALGMYALPKREVLVGYMAIKPEDTEKFPLFISQSEKVYSITQKVYEKHDLLELP